jgi:hypothetical protein
MEGTSMQGFLLAGAGIVILALGFIHYELQLLLRVQVHQDPRSRVEVPSRFFPLLFVVVGLLFMGFGLFTALTSIVRAAPPGG